MRVDEGFDESTKVDCSGLTIGLESATDRQQP